MRGKVIFIDTVHPILADRLENMGFECDWKTELSMEDVLNILPEYTGAVIRSKFKMTKDVLDRGKNLKFICRSGSGMENIDTAYAKEKGILCINSPEGNRDAVGEHTVGMLLALFNNLIRGDKEVRQGMWHREENRGIEIKGKTIGIIGYGNMGMAFAQRLKGFGANVLAHDKYRTDYSDQYAKESSLEEIYSQADVVSIHLPLNDETMHYINKDFIQRFEKDIFIINTSRGKQLVTADLVAAVKSGKVRGACLDVLEFESSSFEQLGENIPGIAKELFELDNVLLSPHVAGWTIESYEKLSSVLADKVAESIK